MDIEIRARVVKNLREIGYDHKTIVFYDGYIIEFLGDKIKEDDIDFLSAICGSPLQFIRSYEIKKVSDFYIVNYKYSNYIFISRGKGYKSRKYKDDMSAWEFWDRLCFINE